MPFPLPLVDDDRRDSTDHQARCGTCRQWLHITEAELLTSLDTPLICWSCDSGGPSPHHR